MGSQCCPGVPSRRLQYVWSTDGEDLLTLADNWDVKANPMERDDFGIWSITLPAKDGAPAIPHNSKVKVLPVTYTTTPGI
jgi:1,4-alpha-glucan branching enzyme